MVVIASPHHSGRLARTRAVAKGGGTAFPHRATCLVFWVLPPGIVPLDLVVPREPIGHIQFPGCQHTQSYVRHKIGRSADLEQDHVLRPQVIPAVGVQQVPDLRPVFQIRVPLRSGHHSGDDAEVAAAGGDGLHRLRHGAAQVGPLHFDQVGGRQGVVVHGRDGVERFGHSGTLPGICSAVELGQVRRQDALPVFCGNGVERIPGALAMLVAPVVFDQAGRRQAVTVGGVNGHKRVRHSLSPYSLGLLCVVLDQGRRHHALLRL